MGINLIILLFSAISFIIYGINSFISKKMISEYERWGYKNQRIILGSCQLLGGLGLLVGLAIPLMLSVASFLLMCMMLTAVFVRIKIKEKVVKMLPAVLYVALNFIIFYNSIV
ncbi:MAG: Uncharacterised protein [Owenweeksia sp. TMED14]|nr:MAG: Uncharacterised protein [Owenweeksia sp. TMED14]|tara:strand:- start:53 stop:391 length:339 start_codon:yes stop_codon:yes gene_type:complete